MRAALYARVSTVNHGQDPEVQLRELRAYCAARGWDVAAEHVDRGISGATARRPALDVLLAAVTRGELDVVLVYRYDRFARSMSHLVNSLDFFRQRQVDFVSLHDGVDTTTAQGRLLFGIMASIAEFERELIRERIRSGLAHARAQGKRLGRPPGPGRPRVRIPHLARVRGRVAGGESVRALSRELGVSHITLLRQLRRADR